MIIKDETFKEHLAKVAELDWTGLELWAVGGIVSDWQTQDIDCVILGDYDESKIAGLIHTMRELGPWSPYYTEDPNPFVTNLEWRRKIKIAFPIYGSTDQLNWRYFKLPTTKWMARKRQGIMNGEPILLIQDGKQIYL